MRRVYAAVSDALWARVPLVGGPAVTRCGASLPWRPTPTGHLEALLRADRHGAGPPPASYGASSWSAGKSSEAAPERWNTT